MGIVFNIHPRNHVFEIAIAQSHAVGMGSPDKTRLLWSGTIAGSIAPKSPAAKSRYPLRHSLCASNLTAICSRVQ